MGPYAGLCEQGAEEAKARRRENRDKARNERKKTDHGDGSIKQEILTIQRSKRQLTKAAGEIVIAAENFEEILERRDEIKMEAVNGLARLNVALEDFKRIARAKLDSKYVTAE